MADRGFCSVLLPFGLWSSDSLRSLCLRLFRKEQSLVDTHTDRCLTYFYRRHGTEGTDPAARLGQPGGKDTIGASSTTRETLRALLLDAKPPRTILRVKT